MSKDILEFEGVLWLSISEILIKNAKFFNVINGDFTYNLMSIAVMQYVGLEGRISYKFAELKNYP